MKQNYFVKKLVFIHYIWIIFFTPPTLPDPPNFPARPNPHPYIFFSLENKQVS